MSNPKRVLMYSHDTFGLGHLRRTRSIAHALAQAHSNLSVLIISGSSIAGAFDFKARVDFVKIPSVIKLRSGEYQSLSDHIDVSETLQMRRSIIDAAASSFRPDMFIVDKEPRGLRCELDPTLVRLNDMGTRIVLGLREVLDAPEAMAREWARNACLTWVDHYYDDVWVYGSQDFWNPLAGVPISNELRNRIVYTGFLRRTRPAVADSPRTALPESYLLVTAGGGGDGYEIMDQVLKALELRPAPSGLPPVVMVLGPFMPSAQKRELFERGGALDSVELREFDTNMEALLHNATAVVSMGGYNSFCELMSFDKRALLVPRMVPRREQFIRANRAQFFGLVDMIGIEDAANPELMLEAMRRVLVRSKPSEQPYRLDMDGHERIADLIDDGPCSQARPQTLLKA